MRHPSILLLFVFFTTQFSTSFAQLDIGEVTTKYNSHFENFPRTRVHLELNQPKYSPGDTAYFKAYFLSYSFEPIKGDQLITVQLLNEKQERVHTQNVKVTNGKGDNQLIFPATLPPGMYTLEAYNDWMKNFDSQFFFRKQVDLAGRRKVALASQQESAPQLFSEGGALVANVTNHVIITSTQRGTGSIVSEAGVVRAFEIGDDGFTTLTFKPTSGEKYFVKMNRSERTSEAIEAKEDGCALEVLSLGECSPLQLQISVPAHSTLRNQQLFLITTAYGKVTYSKVFTLSDLEMTTALIPYRSLHDGLNQIFIMNRMGEVLVERIYFLSPMYSQVEIKVNTQDLLFPRDSVELQVLLTDFFGNPIKGEYSVSVTNQKLFERDEKVPSLRSALYLFSDLPDLQAQFQANTSDEDFWMKSINEWLITQTWKRNTWKEILSPEERTDDLTPFRKSLSLKGRIVIREGNLPLQDSATISFYQDKKKIVYSTQVNSNGEFDLPLINDYANSDRFYYKVEPINPKIRLRDYHLVSEMVVDSVAAREQTFSEQPDTYGEYMHNKRIIDHSYSIYQRRAITANASAVEDPNSAYLAGVGGADVEITMSDYVVFATMEDLIHEVVGGLQVRKSAGASTIRVPIFSGGYTRIPAGDPLYIINGLFTLDTKKFLALAPDQMVYLKIVNDQNKLSRFGAFGTHGIVVVLTQEKQIHEQSLNSKFIELAGLNQSTKFPITRYSGSESNRIPQLRSALYWNPSISNDFQGLATVKIKLTDDIGPMQVSVSGVTFDGNPFSGAIRFIVNRPGFVVMN